jgi:hypothetical protein
MSDDVLAKVLHAMEESAVDVRGCGSVGDGYLVFATRLLTLLLGDEQLKVPFVQRFHDARAEHIEALRGRAR